MNPDTHTQPTDYVVLQHPITGKTLEAIRTAVQMMGATRHTLVIRTWPELEKAFRSVAGFRMAEHYADEETDDMVPGEIGRVGGFRIVIRWNGRPTRAPDGLMRSEVTGGVRSLSLDIEDKH